MLCTVMAVSSMQVVDASSTGKYISSLYFNKKYVLVLVEDYQGGFDIESSLIFYLYFIRYLYKD